MEEFKERKTPRLQGFDYNKSGAYFATICTQNRRCILSRVVGTPVPTSGQTDAGRYLEQGGETSVGTRATRANSAFSSFVSTFKRFCNREYGQNIWQARAHDHVIRNREDYEEHLRYIYNNPLQWCYDELYSEN